ncbi:hypothetical protein SBA4_2920005 [Candidatus Sulfopaludibacter sp. SbA4]|nr:hypothetical protein SBA4_2920005 [Candidatus Sulfopaludibacter sp. SbA4]
MVGYAYRHEASQSARRPTLRAMGRRILRGQQLLHGSQRRRVLSSPAISRLQLRAASAHDGLPGDPAKASRHQLRSRTGESASNVRLFGTGCSLTANECLRFVEGRLVAKRRAVAPGVVVRFLRVAQKVMAIRLDKPVFASVSDGQGFTGEGGVAMQAGEGEEDVGLERLVSLLTVPRQIAPRRTEKYVHAVKIPTPTVAPLRCLRARSQPHPLNSLDPFFSSPVCPPRFSPRLRVSASSS